LFDKKKSYDFCDEKDVTYSKGSQPGSQITQWQHNYEYRKGEWTINDYNFKESKKKLTISSKPKSKFSTLKKF